MVYIVTGYDELFFIMSTVMLASTGATYVKKSASGPRVNMLDDNVRLDVINCVVITCDVIVIDAVTSSLT